MLKYSFGRLPRSLLLSRAPLAPCARSTQFPPRQLVTLASRPPLIRAPPALPLLRSNAPHPFRVPGSRIRPQPACVRTVSCSASASTSGPGHNPAAMGSSSDPEPGSGGAPREKEAVAASPRTRAKRGDTEAAGKKPGAGAAKKGARSRAEVAAEGEGAGAAAGAEEEGAPPAAKKARTSRQTKAKAASAAPAAGGEAGEQQPQGGADAAAAAAEAAPAAKAKPQARGKKGQQAEPLPQYTAALRKPPPPAGAPVVKLLSWNVAGLRGLLKKQPDALSQLVAREGADVVCLQEHKLQGGHTDDMETALGLKGWSHYWACSTTKLGYSGVSIHTRQPPLSVTVGFGGRPAPGSPAAAAARASATAAAEAGAEEPDPEHEGEGRVLTAELPQAYVVSVYVPNSGEGLKRLDYRVGRWDGALAAYVRSLEARGKPVIVTGDLNCAHQEIDIHAPKTNLRSAGFTVEERESFGRLLLGEVGLVDTFRRLFPNTVGYTYFTRRFNCREKNKGWRLDYFLTSASLMPWEAGAGGEKGAAEAGSEGAQAAAPAPVPPPATQWRVYDSWILQDVYGSDHLPLGLTLVAEEEGQ
ncbi:hypothetical protein Agub_g1653 [Astrephomene gubernaculifera]|uniref:DNA-(apurinic or apyrimidinic site) endonuclease n=1 Tax=Astrephomene gubernaculifera TaxID=47775 RepID=A0AAD3DHX3_9CHLO|nr:hypothetical protein Agub_g1653 [Astrephomene gubernaculifera]